MAVDAAATSRTVQQFAKRFGNGNGNGGAVRAAAGGVSITTLTVEQGANGYTIVTVGYSDGHTYIHAFPS